MSTQLLYMHEYKIRSDQNLFTVCYNVCVSMLKRIDMYVYIYVCMHACMCVYVYVCKCVYLCICTYVCIFMYVSVFVCTETQFYIPGLRINVCACMYVYTYTDTVAHA